MREPPEILQGRPVLEPGQRQCQTCRSGIIHPPPAPPLCDQCGALALIHFTQWPREVVPWLIGTSVGHMMAPYAPDWHFAHVFLLRSTTSARQWGGRILSHVASDEECYNVATTEAARWLAAGRPRLFGPNRGEIK